LDQLLAAAIYLGDACKADQINSSRVGVGIREGEVDPCKVAFRLTMPVGGDPLNQSPYMAI
jgi:hypothetical protein